MNTKTFLDEIRSIPMCEDVDRCIQCGTCTGSCPFESYIKDGPRSIIYKIRNNMRDEVLSSPDIWLCSSCYSCAGRCPKGIKITDIMYSLKRLSEAKTNQQRFVKSFFTILKRTGRNQEGELMTRYFVKKPWKIFSHIGKGLKLFLKGRLNIIPHGIDKKSDLKNLLDKKVGEK